MKTKEELKDEELEKVTGGVNMLISKENNNITIDMQEGNYSVNKLFADAESTILKLGGTSGWKIFFHSVRPILNEYKDKITKCVIDINTFEPIYYIGNMPYTQNEVDNW